jgi:phage shock protein A
MRVFTRLKHTVSTSIESLVDQIENQEAVAQATVRKLEQGVARVRLHRKRAERRANELRRRVAEHESGMQLWRERATRLRDDREKAIECIRRYQADERARGAASVELEHEERLIDQIAADERTLLGQEDDLKRRCASLASRDARASASAGVDGLGDALAVFDRWEARVEEREATTGARERATDAFATSLDKDEERAALERILDDVLGAEVTS